jgi:hypothetical protein
MKRYRIHNIEVKIYETHSLMRKALSRIGYKKEYAEAMVIPIEEYKKVKGKIYKTPLVAEMYLHKGLDVMVIAHECLHAATSIIRRNKKSLNLGTEIYVNEERLAYTQSLIFQEILKVFFPKKLMNFDFGDIEQLANYGAKKFRRSI